MSRQLLHLVVKEVIHETEDAITIRFERPTFPFVYEAGQFITLMIPFEDQNICRAYSLCSSPYSEEPHAITIKRVINGRASNYLNDSIKPGVVLKVLPPQGKFVTAFHTANKRHLIFIGAGSGISPLMSILKSALVKEPQTIVSLIYGNRNEESIIYSKALSELETQYPTRFNLVHILSNPFGGWEGWTGRLDAPMLRQILEELPQLDRNNTEYFLCGPLGFMQTVIATLNNLGIPSHRVIRENFGVPIHSFQKAPVLDRNHSVILHFEGNIHKIVVAPGETILDAALDEGIDLPYSCCTGVCTVCLAKKHSGSVKMTEDEGLTEEEKNEGYILTCVAYPTTNDVEIEFE